MPKKPEVLAIIPARAGSKRIPGKNTKAFLGRPLIAYAIEQSKKTKFITRTIVDTDSVSVARTAQKYGAEVPFLRPRELARDTSKVIDSIFHLLAKLKSSERYTPDYIVILQTTSPLRELADITACWDIIRSTNATTVLTVAPTHPRLYHLSPKNDIKLVNGSEKMSTNMQAWPAGYLLNGCFVYIVKTTSLLKEKVIITKKTKAVVCPKWRSVDLDTPEEWVMAEVLYKNKAAIEKRIKKI
jgi:CMP-N,N'-diacetyllegionaminic acid synthase